MANKPKLAVLIPCYGSVPVIAYQKMISFVAALGNYFDAHISTSSSCYLQENRSHLVKRFMDADTKIEFDYVLWLDSDIVMKIEDLGELFESMKSVEADMVTGVYLNDFSGELIPMIMKKSEKEGHYVNMTVQEMLSAIKDGKKAIQCDAAGFGIVLMKAQVLRKMVANNLCKSEHRIFHYREHYDTGEMEGEDVCFFEDAKELGFQLWVVPHVKVDHCKAITI